MPPYPGQPGYAIAVRETYYKRFKKKGRAEQEVRKPESKDLENRAEGLADKS